MALSDQQQKLYEECDLDLKRYIFVEVLFRTYWYEQFVAGPTWQVFKRFIAFNASKRRKSRL